MAAEPLFREGEGVEWTTREASGPVTRRAIFEASVNGTQALIRYGQNAAGGFRPHHLTVPIAELRRPAPAPPIYTIPPRYPDATPQPLAPRRAALRLALDEAHTAAAATAQAAAAADRADDALRAAQDALARFAATDQAAADRFADALRAGTPADDGGPANPADRDAAKRRESAARTAAAQLTAELAAAHARANEADRHLRAAARAVLAGIAEREGDALAALEAEAAQRRAELLAVAEYWPAPAHGDGPAALQLSGGLARLLTNPPDRVDDPPMMRQSLVEGRQRPWRVLFEHLVGGNADADLDGETPAHSAG